MARSAFNPSSKTYPDTGLGTLTGQIGGRFVNKDGSFNLRKVGLPYLKRHSFYSYLMESSWPRFAVVILVFYLLVNLVFTSLYLLVGREELQGLLSTTTAGRIREIFYFSTQTFTTVGYGRINPVKDGADLVAAIESMSGWLFFALVTGLLYGRFTRPKAFVAFSQMALISPFREGKALMFRMVPYKSNHHLSDVKVSVSLSMMMQNEGEPTHYQFFQLSLERARIDMFNMNWTVVHPIDPESPLLGFTEEDLKAADAEILVQVSGFDPLFSNMVMTRSSYTAREVVWNARFHPMYRESADGTTTVLQLNMLNAIEKIEHGKAGND